MCQTMPKEKFPAFLRLARVSNLPTVFSNVLLGVAIIAGAGPFPWEAALIAVLGTSFLYISGMALNDLLDRHIDAVERPERPIPSGVLSVREVTIFVALCFALPLAAVFLIAPRSAILAVALVAAIVLYNVFHKRWSGALVFMGLCRALVYFLAAMIAAEVMDRPMDYGTVGLFAFLLALYIILLTTIAQKEVKGDLGFRRWLAVLVVLLPFAALLFTAPISPTWTLATGALLFAWLGRSARLIRQRPPRVVPAVLGWLSGISLLDAFFLSFTQRPELALIALGCFAATVAAHRRIAGT